MDNSTHLAQPESCGLRTPRGIFLRRTACVSLKIAQVTHVTLIILIALIGLLFLRPSGNALAADLPVSFRTEAFLLDQAAPPANVLSPAPGTGDTPLLAGDILLAVWITPENGYHFYAHNPGDTGRPTEVVPNRLLEGMRIYYPSGVAKKDVFDPAATVMIHDGPTPVFIRFPATSAKPPLEITIKLLLCSQDNCWPVHHTLKAEWNTSKLAYAEAQPWWPLSGQYTEIVPTQGGETVTVGTSTSRLATELGAELGVELPSASGGGTRALPATKDKNGKDSSVSLSDRASSSLFSSEKGYSITPVFFMQSLEVTSLGKAVLFGLIAGFILNFMPCVLPVISLKLSSIVSATNIADNAARMRSFREHNLLFAAGILTWFLALAAILSVAGLAWGQLFQDQRLVTALLLLVFTLGLSTFDVFDLPMLNLRGISSAQGNGRWSAFSTGLLATLLATPCSGPFLGGVLGWAFMQPPVVLATILVAVGAGMALPYLGMAAWPGLVTHFPKPGAWTVTLQRVVGFFLMGTAGYLLTILPATRLPFLLALLWLTAFAAWIWGRFAGLSAPPLRRWIVRALCLALIAGALMYDGRGTKEGGGQSPWQTFSQQQFLESAGRHNLVLDFTADWCPNCKILEHTVLTEANRARWAQEYGAVFIKVDLTRENEEGYALLRALGSQSIPVVAFFPAGEKAASPLVLRDLFTTDVAEAALRQAFGP
ncbi:protein-disulfide reductase DsbD family protein [Desulfovibrio psychrotolerans]|uniref:Thio:disulfide interchange protein n=1 Tax=Desulfovibrio psychrotolerans TaxID=415242 RepID=A0A7J0BVF3_9BACT|nr:cytochrome c biogenesis protein CcdA [Desulfovibrio psychrotolerans]GFM37648.1 thio:disulfide interchange protein [Desulfovibrio psychrotolerans]